VFGAGWIRIARERAVFVAHTDLGAGGIVVAWSRIAHHVAAVVVTDAERFNQPVAGCARGNRNAWFGTALTDFLAHLDARWVIETRQGIAHIKAGAAILDEAIAVVVQKVAAELRIRAWCGDLVIGNIAGHAPFVITPLQPTGVSHLISETRYCGGVINGAIDGKREMAGALPPEDKLMSHRVVMLHIKLDRVILALFNMQRQRRQADHERGAKHNSRRWDAHVPDLQREGRIAETLMSK
jgi:hypothetical protein